MQRMGFKMHKMEKRKKNKEEPPALHSTIYPPSNIDYAYKHKCSVRVSSFELAKNHGSEQGATKGAQPYILVWVLFDKYL